jgi:hypothetical protein
MVSRAVCLGVGIPWSDICFLSDNYWFLDVRRPLWREDESVIYLYNCFWALLWQSLSGQSPAGLTTIFYCLLWDSRTWRARSPRIYIPPEQGGPDIPPGTGFPFCRLLRLAGLWWRYSNHSPHSFTVKINSHIVIFDISNAMNQRSTRTNSWH